MGSSNRLEIWLAGPLKEKLIEGHCASRVANLFSQALIWVATILSVIIYLQVVIGFELDGMQCDEKVEEL